MSTSHQRKLIKCEMKCWTKTPEVSLRDRMWNDKIKNDRLIMVNWFIKRQLIQGFMKNVWLYSVYKRGFGLCCHYDCAFTMIVSLWLCSQFSQCSHYDCNHYDCVVTMTVRSLWLHSSALSAQLSDTDTIATTQAKWSASKLPGCESDSQYVRIVLPLHCPLHCCGNLPVAR